MNRRNKEMSMVCFTYDHGSDNLEKQHENGSRKGLDNRAGLVLADTPYSEQRDENNGHANYNEFVLNDTKDKEKGSGRCDDAHDAYTRLLPRATNSSLV